MQDLYGAANVSSSDIWASGPVSLPASSIPDDRVIESTGEEY